MSVIKPNTQVKILSEEHSEQVQRLAFNAGFEWIENGKRSVYVPVGYYIKFYSSMNMRFSADKNWFEEVIIDLPQLEPSSKAAVLSKPLSECLSHSDQKKLSQPSIESKILAEKVGRKFDQEKPMYNLIPVHAESEFVDVLTFGAKKYGPENWREVDNPQERYIAAAMRHIASYRMGDTHDHESGKHALAHAMCCLSFIIEKDIEQDK